MSKIFFTSDPHYGHANILKYCPNRDFKNTHEMEKALIKNWNDLVEDSDEVFVIGDFTLDKNPEKIQSILEKLNGTKHLILGNHDNLKPFQYVECGFTSVHTSLKLPNGYILAHDPAVATALSPGSVLLHGHVHELWKNQTSNTNVVMYNVGVDVHGLKPISLADIILEIEGR